MPQRIRRRRPIGWNAVLAKGHVHVPSQSKARHADRQSMEDEVAEYMNERQARQTVSTTIASERAPGRRPSDSCWPDSYCQLGMRWLGILCAQGALEIWGSSDGRGAGGLY